MEDATRSALDRVYREESGRLLATLIRTLGDFDLAEEALHEAFTAALVAWPEGSVPDSPRAWLLATARRKAVDVLRRRRSFREKQKELEATALVEAQLEATDDDGEELDDRLRLIFTCCHPALSIEAQVALTLRTLCGLSTDEIARAFLQPSPTIAQRIVRAKGKIHGAGIPYRVPPRELLPERLSAVMAVVYLVFNEGYAPTSGEGVLRRELCAEAIRLGRMLCELLPEEAAPRGLLALMLLHDARRETREDASGDLVLLEEQDRSRWDRSQIDEGLSLVEAALRGARPSPYAVQAAIAALHARAPRADQTDWPQIAALYEVLSRIAPSPIVELNRAVAVAMVDGPARGLLLVCSLEARGELAGYHLLHAAKADLLRRTGDLTGAARAYEEALARATNAREKRFLVSRLATVLGR